MFEEEIAEQKLFLETLQSELAFYELLILEADSTFASLLEEESTKSYLKNLFGNKEKAEESYFNNLAELWMLESNNTILETDEA